MIHFKDISIPKPCSVDYDTLPGDKIKRFCGSCEKHVYDFRGKDEAYLNEIFQATGKVCGIYYKDQIQTSGAKTNCSFYSSVTTKLIGIGLFFKTIFTTHDTNAAIIKTHQTIQKSTDSTRIKTVYKGHDNKKSSYEAEIKVYVNNTFKEYLTLQYQNNIYLSDSINPTDEIKLIVTTIRYNVPSSTRKTNSKKYKPFKGQYTTEDKKEYHFNFSDSEKITIKINFHRIIHLFLRKRHPITGLVCPSNFW